MAYDETSRRHYHNLWTNADLKRIQVYPSNVDVTFEDGCLITIDVGMLYTLFAAHMYQNGFWNDIDWTKVPDGVKARFEGYGLPKGDGYSTGGGIYGIKRTYSHDVPLHDALGKPMKGIRALRRRRTRLPAQPNIPHPYPKEDPCADGTCSCAGGHTKPA